MNDTILRRILLAPIHTLVAMAFIVAAAGAAASLSLHATDTFNQAIAYDALYANTQRASIHGQVLGLGTPSTIIWTNLINAIAEDGDVEQTSNTCQGCAVAGTNSSQKIISGDGYFEFTTAPEAYYYVIAGLNTDSSASTSTKMSFAFEINGGYVSVREGGVYKSDTPFTPGNAFRVAIESGKVKYYKNGTVFYTSLTAPTYPLVADVSMQSLGSKLWAGKIAVGDGVVTPPPAVPTPPPAPSCEGAVVNPDSGVCPPTPPTPLPPEPVVNIKPVGNLDSVSKTTKTVNGWSKDPNYESKPNKVHLYFDGRPGAAGVTAYEVVADKTRTDVGAHGFNFPIPAKYLDNKWHRVYAYGIDINDTTGKSNVNLSGSPKYFRMSGGVVTPPPPNQAPTGNFDGVSIEGNAFGWALDSDTTTQSVAIHFYVDKQAGSGVVPSFTGVADNARSDISGSHAFSVAVPSSFKNGVSHSLYAYAIDTAGDGAKNILLPGSPRNFILGTPATTQPPTISSFSASPTSMTAGASSTLSWNVSGATSLSINQNVGTVTGTTSKVVSPTATTTYTLTATNSSGSVTSTVVVSVSTVVVPPTTGFDTAPYTVYSIPAAPTLPAAGGVMTDPTFGTPIMRITDSSNGLSNNIAYSYWPTFNKNSTKLYLFNVGGGPTYYDFDPVNFKLGAKHAMFVGGSCQSEDAIWSGVDENVIFCHDLTGVIKSYNVATGQWQTIKATGKSGNQMSKSTDDQVFAYTWQDANYQPIGYVVYNRTTDTVKTGSATSADEVQLDKTGRYLAFKTGLQGAGAIEVKVIDLQNNTVTDLIDDADYAPGHSDSGVGTIYGADNWMNRILSRNLATPKQWKQLIQYPDWTQGQHISALADNESTVLNSNFSISSGGTGQLKDEIFLIATDGSGGVKHLLHHHSAYSSYFDSPRASISRDGKFVTFASNWGRAGVVDVFVAKIDSSSTPPPPAPTNIVDGYGDTLSATQFNGWFFSQVGDTAATIVYENTANTASTFTQTASRTATRTDAEQYLRTTYGQNFTVTQPLGFSVNPSTVVTTPGTYRIKSVKLNTTNTTILLGTGAQGTFTIGSPVTVPVISSFTASPTSITAGASSTLSWNVTGATSLSINQNVGTVTGTASKVVTPTATTTYTLTATNSSGSVTGTAMVTVSTVVVPPVTTSAVELPRVYVNSSYPTLPGSSIIRSVKSSCSGVTNCYTDFQAALNAAVPGDQVVIDAGLTLVAPSGGFILPAKSNPSSQWVIVRTANIANIPAAGTRVSPSYASQMPKILANDNLRAIDTANGASYYRFVGVEVSATSSVTSNSGLIMLGSLSETNVANQAHHIVFDRTYVHGVTNADTRRGFFVNAAHTAIVDSYISEFHDRGADAQAILGDNTPGPFKVLNNYLEASGENFLIGGIDAAIPGVQMSDVEIRGNLIAKPLSWRGGPWVIKNLLELKSGQRILIDGNILENSWVHAQNGMAINIKTSNQDGGMTWSETKNVTISNNIIRHAALGITVTDHDSNGTVSGSTNHIYIANNLFDDISAARWGNGVGGTFIQLLTVSDITFSHNTALHDGNTIVVDVGTSPNFKFLDNIVSLTGYGIKGSGSASGNGTIATWFPNSTFAKNVMIGDGANYPTNNFYPSSVTGVGFTSYNGGVGGDYRLTSTSAYRNAASDGTDVGANINAVSTATSCVMSGICGGGTPPVNPPSPVLTISSFTASPASITTGSSSTLSWSVSGATSLSINQGVGIVTGTTSKVVNPTATTTYTLTATNSSGSVTGTATVTVNAVAPTTIVDGYGDTLSATKFDGWFFSQVGDTAATIVYENTANTASTFTQTATRTIVRNDARDWLITNYGNNFTIPQFLGFEVNPSSVVTTPGTYRIKSVKLNQSQTNILLAPVTPTSPGAQGTFTVASTVAVPVISSFTASPTSITAGATSTLSWNVTGATSLSINQNVGTVTGTTSKVVSPTATTTYTLTATNSSGSVTSTATVTVSTVVVLPAGNATVTVNTAQRFQTMNGWEAVSQSGAMLESNSTNGQSNVNPGFAQYKNSLYDQAAADGINRLRLELYSYTENSTDYFSQYINGQISFDTLKTKWYQVVNDNADVNSINASGFKFSQLDFDIDNYVLPMKQRLEAKGEQLAVNLCFVHFSASSSVHSTNGNEYGELMLATFQHIQSKYGFVPATIELMLEPDNGTPFNGTNLGNAMLGTQSKLAAAGFTPKFILPSTTSMQNTVSYFDAAKNVVGAAFITQNVEEISYHLYGGYSSATVATILSRANQYGVKTSQLEYMGATVDDLLKDLKEANVSAWEEFVMAFPGTGDDGASYYVISGTTVTPGSRMKLLRQYFKFVRKGAVRVGATSTNSALNPVAFENSNGKQVVVVKTTGSSSFTIGGIAAGTYGVMYTVNGTTTNGSDMVLAPGQNLSTSIPGAGVITLYQK